MLALRAVCTSSAIVGRSAIVDGGHGLARARESLCTLAPDRVPLLPPFLAAGIQGLLHGQAARGGVPTTENTELLFPLMETQC